MEVTWNWLTGLAWADGSEYPDEGVGLWQSMMHLCLPGMKCSYRQALRYLVGTLIKQHKTTGHQKPGGKLLPFLGTQNI